MARIRTVKPELFAHEELFDAEKETGLPLRLAFISLFTCCDREGRFKWRPRTLKKDMMPYDDIDLSRVLDALATRGFIVKYAFGTEEFGAIPSWPKHQVINNRESQSEIHEPTESSIISMTSTRARRVDDACATPLVQDQGEGNGREGNGMEKEEEGKKPIVPLKQDRVPKGEDQVPGIFAYWQKHMNSPRSVLDAARRTLIERALKNYTAREVCEAIRGCSLTPHNMGINDRNEKYNGLKIILRDADQIDRFISTARRKPNGAAVNIDQTEAEKLADIQNELDKLNGHAPGFMPDDGNTIEMEDPDAQQ